MIRAMPRRPGVLSLCLTAAYLVAVSSRADEPALPPSAAYDCGFTALFYLLRLEGRAASIEQLQARLPQQRPAGYTMLELRDAAAACGLATSGAHLKSHVDMPDRPGLTFVKRGAHGHYIVVRPVGHSGKLVQVFDQSRVPHVLDRSALFASPGWTGLVLMPERPAWRARLGATLLIAPIGLLTPILYSRFRQVIRERPAREGDALR